MIPTPLFGRGPVGGDERTRRGCATGCLLAVLAWAVVAALIAAAWLVSR